MFPLEHIAIRQAAYYHPEKVVHNDYYLNHFKSRGKDIARFLQVMGREQRYIAAEGENALTMGYQAARKVLSDAGIASEDLDMIVFSSQTPEYTYPTNALLLHHMLRGKSRTITLDSNANCAGMVAAVEQASRYMQSNPHVRYALVVGSDLSSVNCNPEDEITLPNFGDAAAAVILERRAEGPGFIDSLYYTDSDDCENIMFPACGLSNIYNPEMTPEQIRISWKPFDGTCVVEPAAADIEEVMRRNGLTLDDIAAFCLSQFSLKNIELICEKLGADMDKFIYVGDEFGYTGTSSPFIALQRGIEHGSIKRGDYIFFWSVGAGWQLPTVLFQY